MKTNTDAVPCFPTDEELLEGIIAGKETALEELYHRHHPLLKKIIGEILSNSADAEEALQDVFVEVWKRVTNYKADLGKPLGWMICIARRRSIDHLRKICTRAKRGVMVADSDDVLANLAHEQQGTSNNESLATRDLGRHLAGILSALPKEQRQVLRLTYFQHLSQREIAACTGIPLGTIKTRHSLGLRKLLRNSEFLRQDLLKSPSSR